MSHYHMGKRIAKNERVNRKVVLFRFTQIAFSSYPNVRKMVIRANGNT